MARTRLRLWRLAMVLVAVLAAQGGVSVLLLVPRVHAVLRARLERALGRPVQVGRFGVSVWSGLRLEAHYITIGEDPRFGYEFLLRADQLSAAPRWRSLLAGRLEFSRYSFERPSLNLIRTPDARWNFEDWATAAGRIRAGTSGGGGVERVSISNGRINFKRGADKLPFALTGVNGEISSSPDGRWIVNFQAQPFRAGVTLQDAGSLHFTGTVSVTALSAPASANPTLPLEFSMEWDRVSLSDALRLVAGFDYGVRGTLDVSLKGGYKRPSPATAAGPGNGIAIGSASTGQAWRIGGVLRLADVHRWDLPLQTGSPALNLAFDLAGSADRRAWLLRDIVVEARRSQLRGEAAFRLGENAHASLRVVSASIHLDDLLTWYRAFHPGVRPGTSVDGYLGADIALEGWPLQIVHATLATTGARLNVPGETHPIELRKAVLDANGKGGRLIESQLTVGTGEPGVRLSGHANWSQAIPFEANLVGGTTHLAEFSAALAALGLSTAATPLRAEGSATAKLNWKGTVRPWRAETTGTVSFNDLVLSGGLLREPIAVSKARLEFLPARRRIEFTAAKAFGATWTGALGAATLAGPWDFMLAADRLNPALVIRGFSNQSSNDTSLLSRILPQQAVATLALEAPRWPAWLRGEGDLAVNSLALGRLHFEGLKGRLSVGEREVALENAEASAYGGRVRGSVRADFGELPRYAVRTEFDGVNVAALATVAVSTRECCTGIAAGHLELSAKGWTRDALLGSLAGTGRTEVRSGALLTIDLPASLEARSVRPGRTPLREAISDFVLGSGRARLEGLRLEVQSKPSTGQGSVSYRGELDVTLSGEQRLLPKGASAPGLVETVRIGGTLAAPRTP